jgi:hypothetical protein
VIDENHRYPVMKTRLVDECLHPVAEKIFSWRKISAAGRWRGLIFSPAKKSSRGEEISMSGLERLDRLSLPRRAWRQAECQLPVRLDAVLSITSGVAILLDTLSWLDNDVWQP